MKYYVMLFFILLLVAGEAQAKQQPTSRIAYEGLALQTPQTAVETFVHAFQQQDYYSVYLIFSRTTQIAVANKLNSLHYSSLIRLTDGAEAEQLLVDTPFFQPIERWEHRTPIYLFDELMLAAGQQSAFLLDLTGEVTINQTENRTETEADVYATVEGIEGEVIFRLAQSPNGRWRVQQLIAAGGDETQVPWAAP